MGYRLNRLDEPIFMAGPKSMRNECGIHLRLESCETVCPSVVLRSFELCLKIMRDIFLP